MAIEARTIVEPSHEAPAGDPAVLARLRSLQLIDEERRGTSRRRRRMVLWLILLSAAGAGGYAAFRAIEAQTAQAMLTVDVLQLDVPAAQEPILDLSGYIVPRTKISISPQIGGKIIELPIREGMRLAKGDLVARVDDTTFKAELDQAKAAWLAAQNQLAELKNGARPEEIEQARALMQQAQARLDLSRKNHERAQRLALQDSITPSEVDRVIAELADSQATLINREESLRLLEHGPRAEQIAAAEADLQRAAALVEKAEYWVQNATILSPIDGTVLEKKSEAGESVHPELVMTHLCVIADLSKLEAEVDVQEQDLKLVKPGNPCRIIPDAFPDRSYQGRVDRLQPIVNRQRGVVQTRITVLEPDQHLLVEMNCRVLFLDPQAPAQAELPAIRVPRTALVNENSQVFLWVIDQGLARRRPVVLADETSEGSPSDPNTAPIRAGLSGREAVILTPQSYPLREGQAVQPRSNAAPGTAASASP